MNLKKVFLTFFITAAILTAPVVSAEGAEGEITVTVNGQTVQSENKPVIIEGTTFVPLRPAAETMGCEVGWNEEYKAADIHYYNGSYIVITMQIGSNTIYKYEAADALDDYELVGEIACDMAPRVINGSTYIPLRAMAEALDADVSWDSDSKTVIIKTVSNGTYYDAENNVTFELKDNILVISGTGNIENSYSEEYSKFSINFDFVQSIIIERGITGIGRSVFDRCEYIKEVTIPDTVTSIGEGTFSGCDSLSEITIPDSVTEIGAGAFDGCENLIEIRIGAGVTEIGINAFAECESLTNINVDSGNSAYTSVDGVLYNKDITKLIRCPGGKTSITIPDSVTEIQDYAFDCCDGLTEITIPNSVTTIGSSAFKMCFSAVEITVPSSVTTIGEEAFAYCTALERVICSEGSAADNPELYVYYDYENECEVYVTLIYDSQL